MKLIQELNKLHTVPSQEVMVHLVCLSITVKFVCICAVICKKKFLCLLIQVSSHGPGQNMEPVVCQGAEEDEETPEHVMSLELTSCLMLFSVRRCFHTSYRVV